MTFTDNKTLIKGIVELSFNHAATSDTLGCHITQISQRNKNGKDLPVLSVSNKHGFVEQSEQFEDRIIASDDKSNYKIVSINDFAFNPARINVGSIVEKPRDFDPFGQAGFAHLWLQYD